MLNDISKDNVGRTGLVQTLQISTGSFHRLHNYHTNRAVFAV